MKGLMFCMARTYCTVGVLLMAAMGSVRISAMVIWLSLWTELQSLGTINGLATILGLVALATGTTVWCERAFHRRFPQTLAYS